MVTKKVNFFSRLELGFFQIDYPAEFLNSLDEFFCLELTLVLGAWPKQPVVQVLMNSNSARLKNELILPYNSSKL